MNFEIIQEDKSIKIINEKGDYIDLDFPNEESWKLISKFLEDSER